MLLVFCGCVLTRSYVELGPGCGTENWRPARRGLSGCSYPYSERGGNPAGTSSVPRVGRDWALEGTKTVQPYIQTRACVRRILIGQRIVRQGAFTSVRLRVGATHTVAPTPWSTAARPPAPRPHSTYRCNDAQVGTALRWNDELATSCPPGAAMRHQVTILSASSILPLSNPCGTCETAAPAQVGNLCTFSYLPQGLASSNQCA